MNKKVWIKGLISATISGSAASIGTMIAAPQDFNLTNGLKRLLMVALVSGIIGAANYLKQSPIPDEKWESK